MAALEIVTKFIVIANGHPEDRSTWSGTPANIVAALAARGHTIFPCDVSATTRERVVHFLQHECYRVPNAFGHRFSGEFRRMSTEARSDYQFQSPIRRSRARRATQAVAATSADAVLSLGSAHLPLIIRPRIPHLIYLDSISLSLARWSNLEQRLGRRLWLDRRLADDKMISQADVILTASEYVAADIRSLVEGSRPRIVAAGAGCGVEVHMSPAPAAAQLRGHALFVARHSFVRKGGELLLESLAYARARHGVDIPLVMVLEAPTPLPRGLADLVTIIVRPSRRKYSELFRTARLYAAPALNEPLGLVYIEAAKQGVPSLMLARNTGPEFTADGSAGYLVEDPIPQAVSEALIEAFTDDAGWARRRAAAIALSQRYDWNRVAMNVELETRAELDG